MRRPIDVSEVQKYFRLKNGEIERLDLRRKGGVWKVVSNKKNNSMGYCKITFQKRSIKYQTILWILSTGKDIPQGLELDHINGDRIDNRMDNLRLVTRRENLQNMWCHRMGQLYGSCFDTQRGLYKTQILIGHRRVYIGHYDSEKEAHEAYKRACEHLEDYVDNDSFRKMIREEV